MIRERNTGCSFYSQDSSRFVLFFGSRSFIGKRISFFIQGCVEGGSQDMKYLIMSLSLGDILEEGIQGVILTREGRGQIGSGGDNPSVGSLGWFWVGMPATSRVAMTVTKMIPSRIAFLVAYEAVILVHVVSTFDQG